MVSFQSKDSEALLIQANCCHCRSGEMRLRWRIGETKQNTGLHRERDEKTSFVSSDCVSQPFCVTTESRSGGNKRPQTAIALTVLTPLISREVPRMALGLRGASPSTAEAESAVQLGRTDNCRACNRVRAASSHQPEAH